MESFQRKPNGGNSSSVARVFGTYDSDKRRAIKPAQTVGRISQPRIENMTPFVLRLVICVCVSAFFGSPNVPSSTLEWKKCVHTPIGQLTKLQGSTLSDGSNYRYSGGRSF